MEAKTWWNCFQESLEGELVGSQAWLDFKNTQLGDLAIAAKACGASKARVQMEAHIHSS